MSGSWNIGPPRWLNSSDGGQEMAIGRSPNDPGMEDAMSAVEPATERIQRRLHDAVERLRQDMDQVEFWTEVLGCLARPVPDYNGGTSVLNRFALPQQGSGATKSMTDLDSNRSAEKDEILEPDRPSNTGRSRH
jgi:hypothetical protein